MSLQDTYSSRPPVIRRFVPERTVHRSQRPAMPSPPTMAVLTEVAARYGLSPDQLIGPSRARHLIPARQEAMALVRQRVVRLTLPTIGRIFGGRHHTTVLQGIRTHEARAAWAEVLTVFARPA